MAGRRGVECGAVLGPGLLRGREGEGGEGRRGCLLEGDWGGDLALSLREGGGRSACSTRIGRKGRWKVDVGDHGLQLHVLEQRTWRRRRGSSESRGGFVDGQAPSPSLQPTSPGRAWDGRQRRFAQGTSQRCAVRGVTALRAQGRALLWETSWGTHNGTGETVGAKWDTGRWVRAMCGMRATRATQRFA